MFVADNGESLFRCESCAEPLHLERNALTCVTGQCAAFGMAVEVWRAQQRRVECGLDVPPPGPGWPRPTTAGRPHPYLTPVTAGRPWWRMVDVRRLEHCQLTWSCQVCGLHLPERAWVVGTDQDLVVNSSALHRRCVHLALAHCPHLAGALWRIVQMTADDVLADGRSVTVDRQAIATGDWRQWWTLSPQRTPQRCH